MDIFPAIDLKEGRVVRLTEGDYGRMDVYGDDPAAVAEGFRAAGATYLHVVDLDGARDGTPKNREALRALSGVKGLLVQTGGGLRTRERVEEALALGVFRVILGTAALRDPDFLRAMVRAYGEKIAVGVDARGGKAAVSGWLQTTDTDAMAFCVSLRDLGVRTVIYTDISRDGKLSGPNLAAYQALSEIGGLRIIASGGVSGEADIAALLKTGVHGAIIGKALYEGRIDLARALKIAAGKAADG